MSQEKPIIVESKDALLEALKAQKDEIVVTGPLVDTLLEVKKGQLSETERLGVDLGSSGTSQILEMVLNKLFGTFKGENKEETKIKEIASNLYNISLNSKNELLLQLKQLSY